MDGLGGIDMETEENENVWIYSRRPVDEIERLCRELRGH